MAGVLEGKVSLITGGSSGIGRAAVFAFAREGAVVTIADVDAAGAEETRRLAREAGGDVAFVRADVTRAADVERMVGEVVARHGRLECAFNNAGVLGDHGPTAACAEENWDRVLAVNLKGVWLCMKYEILQMLKQPGGAIVNTSSAAGLTGWGYRPAYAASKHGVTGLTRAAALEYAPVNIRVNAVCPGIIQTPMMEASAGGDAEVVARRHALHPMGRMGRPEEVAAAVVWLCSDAASFVTGHALAVDGGLVAG